MGWMDTYQYGGNVKKIDSTLNANRDKLGWIDRLYEKNGENIQVEGFEGKSTHLMSQFDNYAVPQVTRGAKGKLEYFEKPDGEYIKKHGIKFPSDKEALSFSQHYKEGTDVLREYQQGGVIEDDRGQWAHPGKITKINSNSITMKGVNYPVLGVSNTGAEKIMMPGEDYKFDGESVTEYPLLDKSKKSSNFTGYNTWMNKYTT